MNAIYGPKMIMSNNENNEACNVMKIRLRMNMNVIISGNESK